MAGKHKKAKKGKKAVKAKKPKLRKVLRKAKKPWQKKAVKKAKPKAARKKQKPEALKSAELKAAGEKQKPEAWQKAKPEPNMPAREKQIEKSKPLDLHRVEEKWQKYWEREKVYAFNAKSSKPVFSIDTPPPTVSGYIHMGSAFAYSQQDFIARYKRMKGFEVFHPIGFDDNGLATERFVEKKRNIQAKDSSRKEFIRICLEESRKAEDELQKTFAAIGMSFDWGLLYRTISDYCRKQAQRSFIDIYNQGRMYQREAPTMWCPKCETAIAQAELEDMDRESTFNYIKFDTTDGKTITIATTRPELMQACVVFNVHPDDKRYKELVGKDVKIHYTDRTVKIEANEVADPEFGTGAVYHCTWGDLDDVEQIMALNLPVVEIMGKDGKLNEKAGKYKGMNAEQARKAIVENLKKDGYLVKQEPIKHVVNVHERCKTPIEIITSKQWFLKYLDLKDEFLARADEVKWHPKYMKSRYDNWIAGLKWDWNVSRQRYFGVPFPVWYCKKCNKVMVADEKDLPVDPLEDMPKAKCGCGSGEFAGEKDVLDTWFTSSLTPQINCRWKEDEGFFKKMFPMDLRPQGHDIITLWGFNTIVKAHMHNSQIPWNDMMINGWALDPRGKKMSKSLGNVISPWDMIEKYSSDVLRYWAGQTVLGEDVPFQEKEMVSGRKFLIKLYNAGRFVSSLAGKFDMEKADEGKLEFKASDRWILSRLNSVKKQAAEALERYESSKALNPLRDFFWLEFADFYIEEVKHRVYKEGGESKSRDAALYALVKVATESLKMLSPFIPHITEEIMQEYFGKYLKERSVHLEQWPEVEEGRIDEYYEALGEVMNLIIAAVRKAKSGKGIALNADVRKAVVYLKDDGLLGKVKEAGETIKETMKIKELDIRVGTKPEGTQEVNKEISVVVEI